MKIILVVFTIFFSSHSIAFDGHNGITFDSRQKDVEKIGFVCTPPKESKSDVLAECIHMDMTGNVFGYPTKNYTLIIGPAKKVDMISADISGLFGTEEYFALQHKIQKLFPTKNKAGSFRSQGVAIRDEWRAPNNAAAVLLTVVGIPPLTKTNTSISFWSPRSIEKTDN